MSSAWWYTDRSAPFAELLSLLQTCYHPDIRQAGAEEELRALVQAAERGEDTGTEWNIPVFLNELRLAVTDPSRIPGDALDRATDHTEGNDTEFLARVWRDIYPGRPLPTE
ncbi:hypothetical protein [Allonocardiopsis opalescens]|uniref:CdiI immunity protein domain-containing protein n=1 Tax=Allonocardiopsis opalescens TaxID=1144618 RepID=A0A2T0Q341_9ACTN|nr:hypothetical protein [Allonocardiopsis opalescens]PRX98140.1 hypothetical protein CLV72_105493 [Allonocardiopsis opalescens]